MTKKQAKEISKQREVRTCFSYLFTPEMMEKVSNEKITVPDEALTIHEILRRHSQGIQSFSPKFGHWMHTEDHDDYDMEKLGSEDLLEVHEQKQNAEALAEVQAQQKTKKKSSDDVVKEDNSTNEEAESTTEKADEITE